MERIIMGGGRSLAEMLPTVTMGVNTASLPNSNIILDDENDEFCYVCALGVRIPICLLSLPCTPPQDTFLFRES